MITDEMVERAAEAQSLFKINFDLKRELWLVFDSRAEPKIVFETTSRKEAEDKVLFLGQRAALDAALAGAWITDKRHPDKPGKKHYEQIPCLIVRRGEVEHAVWNCNYMTWDDPSGDSVKCSVDDVSAWMPLPPPPVKE